MDKKNLTLNKGFLQPFYKSLKQKILLLTGICLLLTVSIGYAQNNKAFQMYGKVKDTFGNPIIGVSISIKGTAKGTTTDVDGNYKLAGEKLGAEVVFSYIGFKTMIVAFKNGEQNIVLADDDKLLDEVVVTGYQKLNVNEAAGAYNKVDMERFKTRIAPSLSTTLEGLSPSLVVSSNPATGNNRLTIRGISTLEGSSKPLIVVDGFPYSSDLSTINPYDIESITLLKDAASASIYGAKSANGVIVITTYRGGSDNLELRYNTNTQIDEKPNIDYFMNRVSSSDMVTIEKAYFDRNKDRLKSYQDYYESGSPYAKYRTYPFNKTVKTLLDHKEGRITDQELDAKLNALRNTNNRDDLAKLLLQTPYHTEHNVAINYGTKRIKIRSSLNYRNTQSGFVGTKNDGVRYSLNSLLDVSDKLRLDLLAKFNVDKGQSYRGAPRRFLSLSPYERFYGDDGSALAVTTPRTTSGTNNGGIYGGKDSYEIQRLKNLGLLDETYYPVSDYGLSLNTNKNWKSYFQAQMRLNLIEGLDGVLGFNVTKGVDSEKTHIDKNSHEMRGFINNLTQKTEKGKKGKLLIPLGSRLQERRSETTDYLLRGQLEYNKLLADAHKLIVLLGSEIQSNKITSTAVDRLGYDKKSNTFKPMDYNRLSKSIQGVFIPDGAVAGGINFNNSFSEEENRYFSLYANGNYTYDHKYSVSGNVRIDQSNLFGTDPKYRFKPFWSVGAKWRIAEEDFFTKDVFSSLDLQLSYGKNGNVSNDYGPYDLARSTFVYLANNANALDISSYSVPDLRWETTNTFNAGLRLSTLKDRVFVSFDYYRKHTRDVLADAEADPTLGSAYIKRNDATISNNGYELALKTINIKTSDFEWSTYLGLNYNKSKVDKVAKRDESAYSSAGRVRNKKGYEPNSLFVFKWAGVDTEGNGQLEKANGDVIAVSPSRYEGGTFDPISMLHEDLVYAGTIQPKLVTRFTNNLRYKNLSLSVMFVHQGGHVLLRDSYNGRSIGSFPASANVEAAYAWKKPGDEKNSNVVPRLGSATYYTVIESSTKNVVDGDFIRLRDIVLSYTLPRSMSKALRITDLTFNVRGNNLYLWTKNPYGIDPETQRLGRRGFPSRKSLSLGVNVIF